MAHRAKEATDGFRGTLLLRHWKRQNKLTWKQVEDRIPGLSEGRRKELAAGKGGRPSLELALAIEAATGGAVRPSDWLHSTSRVAIEVARNKARGEPEILAVADGQTADLMRQYLDRIEDGRYTRRYPGGRGVQEPGGPHVPWEGPTDPRLWRALGCYRVVILASGSRDPRWVFPPIAADLHCGDMAPAIVGQPATFDPNWHPVAADIKWWLCSWYADADGAVMLRATDPDDGAVWAIPFPDYESAAPAWGVSPAEVERRLSPIRDDAMSKRQAWGSGRNPADVWIEPPEDLTAPEPDDPEQEASGADGPPAGTPAERGRGGLSRLEEIRAMREGAIGRPRWFPYRER